MGFRDLDATKAVRELRVSVRCNMTACTNACRKARETEFCALEPEFVSSAWQLLFPCTEESPSIKVCSVARSGPRGGPVRRGRGCAKKGHAGVNGGRGLRGVSRLARSHDKRKVHSHQDAHRRETRLVTQFKT